jgi:hypothetical protein
VWALQLVVFLADVLREVDPHSAREGLFFALLAALLEALEGVGAEPSVAARTSHALEVAETLTAAEVSERNPFSRRVDGSREVVQRSIRISARIGSSVVVPGRVAVLLKTARDGERFVAVAAFVGGGVTASGHDLTRGVRRQVL